MTIHKGWLIYFPDGFSGDKANAVRGELQGFLSPMFSGLMVWLGPEQNNNTYKTLSIRYESSTLDTNDKITFQIGAALNVEKHLGDLPAGAKFDILPAD